jgi:hypothetical protein
MRKGKVVVASFQLVSKKSGSWRFLQVGAYKLGGHILLLVVAREFKELELPLSW